MAATKAAALASDGNDAAPALARPRQQPVAKTAAPARRRTAGSPAAAPAPKRRWPAPGLLLGKQAAAARGDDVGAAGRGSSAKLQRRSRPAPAAAASSSAYLTRDQRVVAAPAVSTWLMASQVAAGRTAPIWAYSAGKPKTLALKRADRAHGADEHRRHAVGVEHDQQQAPGPAARSTRASTVTPGRCAVPGRVCSSRAAAQVPAAAAAQRERRRPRQGGRAQARDQQQHQHRRVEQHAQLWRCRPGVRHACAPRGRPRPPR